MTGHATAMAGLRLGAWLVVALAAAWMLTGIVLRFAIAHDVLDVPGARSSHSAATPRGGGLAIVLVCAIGIAIAASIGVISFRTSWALNGGGLIVAAVGMLDDLKGVRPLWRALVHMTAGAWAVSWLGGFSKMSMGPATVTLGLSGSILAVVGITWSINAYNFMDGIDGLAGAEAVSIALGAGALLAATQHSLAAILAITAGAAGGFLIWNWAPARIFMGDVGSGYLGFLFAVLALASERAGGPPVMAWSILGMVFLFDSTVTLVRRAYRRERIWEAHRSHAYQRLALSSRDHARVVTKVLMLNVVLAVLAWVSRDGGVALVGAWIIAVVASAGGYRYVEGRWPM